MFAQFVSRYRFSGTGTSPEETSRSYEILVFSFFNGFSDEYIAILGSPTILKPSLPEALKMP